MTTGTTLTLENFLGNYFGLWINGMLVPTYWMSYPFREFLIKYTLRGNKGQNVLKRVITRLARPPLYLLEFIHLHVLNQKCYNQSREKNVFHFFHAHGHRHLKKNKKIPYSESFQFYNTYHRITVTHSFSMSDCQTKLIKRSGTFPI